MHNDNHDIPRLHQFRRAWANWVAQDLGQSKFDSWCERVAEDWFTKPPQHRTRDDLKRHLFNWLLIFALEESKRKQDHDGK